MINRKEYGRTFLTRARYNSTNKEKVDKSFFLWRFDKENELFVLSYLGILNAFLNLLNLALTAEVENGYINKYILRKRVR